MSDLKPCSHCTGPAHIVIVEMSSAVSDAANVARLAVPLTLSERKRRHRCMEPPSD